MRIYRVRDSHQQVRLASSDDGETFFGLAGDPFYGDRRITNERVEVAQILAPVEPSTIYCLGHNYAKHVEETGAKTPEFPVVFIKAVTSVQDPGLPILLPRGLRSDEVDFECELAVVIGFTCKNVRKEEALNYVLGYTAANDVSARDWQMRRGGGQFCRAKTFDTFCPLGPCIVTTDEIPNPQKLRISTRLNGECMQDSSTADMIFDVASIIEFLSGGTRLEAGTVILTGTPAGVGMARKPPRWLQPGDKVEIEIERIGVLRNPVEEEKLG
jgi:2-keto-4-pentenoate hydratase/2-oxohepta-3-ene-1,7-dioic acid hydratase in catechol pathway